jgi:hypothetical protein
MGKGKVGGKEFTVKNGIVGFSGGRFVRGKK